MKDCKDLKISWKFAEALWKMEILVKSTIFFKTQGIFATSQENIAKTQAVGKYLRNSRKFAEAPQNCSETQGIFAKIQGKLAESPKMFAKI